MTEEEKASEPAKCDMCGRARTPEDKDYTVRQAALGQPCGWFSHDGEEVCGHDMDKLIRGQG